MSQIDFLTMVTTIHHHKLLSSEKRIYKGDYKLYEKNILGFFKFGRNLTGFQRVLC